MAKILSRLFIFLTMINNLDLRALELEIKFREDFNPFGEEFRLWRQGTGDNCFGFFERAVEAEALSSEDPELTHEIFLFELFQTRYECREKNKQYKCTWRKCKLSFPHENQLIQHMSTHPEKLYKCSYQNCNKSYVQRKDLTAHMFVHSSQNHLKCPKCAALFSYRQSLNRHISTFHSADYKGTKRRPKARSLMSIEL